MTEKVMLVDDETNILTSYRRALRSQFKITTAESGDRALELFRGEGPFAVVVSDMRMPDMNGLQLLSTLRTKAPDTVRIMLTGNADQQTAVDAVNKGDIFRFLNKPCAPEEIAASLSSAIKHYHLITGEKELLEQTLKGSIAALSEILSLTNPRVFGRTTRLKRLVLDCASALNLKYDWELETAVMLCQLGYVTLPDGLIEKVFSGEKLEERETHQYYEYPKVGASLISKIPRMNGVAEIIAYQKKNFDGSGTPEDNVSGANIPVGARILKVVLDFDRQELAGHPQAGALNHLEQHATHYDPAILATFCKILDAESQLEVHQISVLQLMPNMVLAEDIYTDNGTLLMCKGQAITSSVSDRLLNFSRNGTIPDKLKIVRLPEPTDSSN